MNSKIGNLTRKRPEFEPGKDGAEAAQLLEVEQCRRVSKSVAADTVKNQFLDSFRYKYRLRIAYDGTNYCGFQIQPNGMTIQEILEEKLSIILRHTVKVTGASRTDSGVHAHGQAAHFVSDKELDLFRFFASINGLLPPDIRVKEIQSVPPDFHARYSAKNKLYYYHLTLGRVQDPFKRLYSWHIPEKLDLELLKECSRILLGTHDFTSFANEPTAGAVSKNPIRTLKRLDIVAEREGVRLEFEAESFLYKMVRNITGTLIEAAKGKRTKEEIAHILAMKDRRKGGRAAPAHGLFLVGVDYQ
jgi:tRNA pseudouridine38-40 synthase